MDGVQMLGSFKLASNGLSARWNASVLENPPGFGVRIADSDFGIRKEPN